MSLIQQLSKALSDLPGLGPKSAERIVYHLLKRPTTATLEITQLLSQLHGQTKTCSLCHSFFDNNGSALCHICSDPKRNTGQVCVVAEHLDLEPMEATSRYHGRYHVLGGLLNPLEGVTGKHLMVDHLLERLQSDPLIQEVILAFDATMEGETTLLYLKKLIEPYRSKGLIVSRLARGLPTNASLHYADGLTIGDAFNGRQQI